MGFKQPKFSENLRKYGPKTSGHVGDLERMAALANAREARPEKEMLGRNMMAIAGVPSEKAGTAGLVQEIKELGDQYKREARGTVPSDDEGMKKGGKVSSASKRADGIAQRGKTKGRMI